MKICRVHWDMCRAAIKDRGLEQLVAAGGEEAMDRLVGELQGEPIKQTFDPLMSMNWHFTNAALASGGPYLMTVTEGGENDGHFCPICEFKKHAKDFDPAVEVAKVAGRMAVWARAVGLIPPLA